MASSDWQVLIGALGGVTVTGVLGLATAKLTHGWQRQVRVEARREARAELRRSAYVAYLVQAQKLGDETTAWASTTGKTLPADVLIEGYVRDLGSSTHENDACQRRALLAAGPDVRVALEEYRSWFQQALGEVLQGSGSGLRGWEEKERPLMDAMRTELETDMGIDQSARSRQKPTSGA